jgi:hypothetical protein
MLPARRLNHTGCASVKQHFAPGAGKLLLTDQRKTPRKAGFSEIDARVNDNAAWTEYPRQGVVELTTRAP